MGSISNGYVKQSLEDLEKHWHVEHLSITWKGNESSDFLPKNQTRVTLLHSFLLKSWQCLYQVHHLEAKPPTTWGTILPSNRPLCLCPYCWVPATVNRHLMILQGPFNWVENVQVGRAQPCLLKETKSPALHSHRRLGRAHTDTLLARTQPFSHNTRHSYNYSH